MIQFIYTSIFKSQTNAKIVDIKVESINLTINKIIYRLLTINILYLQIIKTNKWRILYNIDSNFKLTFHYKIMF